MADLGIENHKENLATLLNEMANSMWYDVLDVVNYRASRLPTEYDRQLLRTEVVDAVRSSWLPEQTPFDHNLYNRNVAKYALDYLEAAEVLHNLSVDVSGSKFKTETDFEIEANRRFENLAARINTYRSNGVLLEQNHALEDLSTRLRIIEEDFKDRYSDFSGSISNVMKANKSAESNLHGVLNCGALKSIKKFNSDRKTTRADVSSTFEGVIPRGEECRRISRWRRWPSGYRFNISLPNIILRPRSSEGFTIPLIPHFGHRNNEHDNGNQGREPMSGGGRPVSINAVRRNGRIVLIGIATMGSVVGIATPIPFMINSQFTNVEGTYLNAEQEAKKEEVEATISEKNEAINKIAMTYGEMGDVTLADDLDTMFGQIDEGYETVEYAKTTLENGVLDVQSQQELCDDMVEVVATILCQNVVNGWNASKPNTSIASVTMEKVEENDENGKLGFRVEYYDQGIFQDGDELQVAHVTLKPKEYLKEINELRKSCNAYSVELTAKEYSDDELLALSSQLQELTDDFYVLSNTSPNYGVVVGGSVIDTLRGNYTAKTAKSDDYVNGLEKELTKEIEERNKLSQEQLQEEIQNDNTEPETSTHDDESR